MKCLGYLINLNISIKTYESSPWKEVTALFIAHSKKTITLQKRRKTYNHKKE